MLYLLLYFFFIAKADVYLYSYSPNSQLSYNNIIIRETINSKYFAYNRPILFDKSTNYSIQHFKTPTYLIGSTLQQDLFIRNGSMEIGSIYYFYHKSHIFHYVLNIVSSSNTNYHVNINYNNKTVQTYTTITSISIYNFVKVPKGHNLFTIIISSNDLLCNCPSINNGYTNTRFFYGWIDSLQNSENGNVNKFPTSVTIANSIINRFPISVTIANSIRNRFPSSI
jgi:hypothetical protein